MLKITLFSLALIIMSAATLAHAEWLCRQEINMKWKKDKEEVGSQVFFTSVEAKGADEAIAKANLNSVLGSEKAEAQVHCKKYHENLSGCIAAKYASMSSTLSTLSFSARKAVEDSVAKDCDAQQGKCSIEAVDPVCAEIKSPDAVAATAGKKEEKAKKGK